MRELVLVVAVFTACFAAGGSAVQGQEILSYLEVVKCAGQMDIACFLDKSEDIVVAKHQKFLIEADNAALMTGRKSDSGETPSALMETISSMISEISDIFFKHGIAGFFRDGKDEKSESEDPTEVAADDNEEEDDEEDSAVTETKKEADKSRSLKKGASEARGKKKKEKKKKIKAIIKLLILGIVVYGKVTLLLKILAAHLQFKFLAIAAAGLLINAARFYLDLKKGHHPQKVIYYEHAQHQHHYENEDEGYHHGGGYWGRAYDEEEKTGSAQDVAYRKQKPENQESQSWF